MAVMERTVATPGRTGTEDASLADLARGLAELAIAAAEYPAALMQVERGFKELSGLARACGNARACKIARAFSSILAKAGSGHEGDLPFILDTAACYLESLTLKYGCRPGSRT